MCPLRGLVLAFLVTGLTAQTLTINTPETPDQWADISVTWSSTDMADTSLVEFRRCESAPGTGCSGCVAFSGSPTTLNDGKTTLITTSSYPWTVPQGTMYLCMVSSTDSTVSSATPEFTIPTPTLTSLSVGPSKIGQFDDITVQWSSTGLDEKASIKFYRCKEVPDATVDCASNTKCSFIESQDNVEFLRLSSSYTDSYTAHVDDAYLYDADWTTDVGSFYLCMYLSQESRTGVATDPIFVYSSAYKVSSPNLDIVKPHSKSCYDPYETVTVKWETKGGGEILDLYKCKSKPSTSVTCSEHSSCSLMSPANTEVANTGFAYVTSTSKADMTGQSGTFYLCAASKQADSELYSYSGKYTVSDEDNACPLSDGEIAGVTIACIIVFSCLVGACYFAMKRYSGGGGSHGTTTTKDPPVVLAQVYE